MFVPVPVPVPAECDAVTLMFFMLYTCILCNLINSTNSIDLDY